MLFIFLFISTDLFCDHFLLIYDNERQGFGAEAAKPRRRLEDRHAALTLRGGCFASPDFCAARARRRAAPKSSPSLR